MLLKVLWLLSTILLLAEGGGRLLTKSKARNRAILQKSARSQSVRDRRDFHVERQGREFTGIDFSNAVFDEETGKRCVVKEEQVTSLEKDQFLECTHREVEKCHFSYITQFSPTQEEVCEENFEKKCQITFKQQAINETVRKCYRPTQKVCNGQGEEVCKTVYESSCTTRYVEKQPGKFVGDSKCEKLPVEICGAGCVFEEGPEECHDKVVASLVDVPEEACDLNPQKTCKFQTKLVPKLTPQNQCTLIPQEVCTLRFSSPRQVPRPLLTKWCLDDSPVVPSAAGLRESARSTFGNGDFAEDLAQGAGVVTGRAISLIPLNEDVPAGEIFVTTATSNNNGFVDEDASVEQFAPLRLSTDDNNIINNNEDEGSGIVILRDSNDNDNEVEASQTKPKFATQQFEDFVDFGNF